MARSAGHPESNRADGSPEAVVERRARELFEEALLLEPGERLAFVSRLREGTALRRRLEVLLERDAIAESVLDGAIVEPVRSARPTAEPSETPRQMGAYSIEARIAAGGTSVVYLARRRDTPAAPQVAIKWIRGAWAEANLDRVRREARVLSRLDHPGIARLIDVGTESDRPYFVMEYVHGTPITEYCDEKRLTTKERIELFGQVCAAVSHAHRNLVVHRDLKPANILVAPQGEPKLLDFGISAFFDPRQTEQTATLPLFLTPAYASPEQIQGRGISTASDVYALGVLLFELLTGDRPYDWSSCSQHEIYEVLRRDDPPQASRLSRKQDERHWLAEMRGTSPEGLVRQLRGDLDNILRKAMRFDPGDRYASVEQLWEDLRRYLEGLPVGARAATVLYRSRKFVRRHFVGVLNALLVLTFLIGLVVEREIHARRVELERDLARQARERAEQQREKAEEVVSFLVDSFAASDPYQEPSLEITAREILERGAARLENELHDEPAARATLLQTLGRVYLRLGQTERSEELLAEALRLHRDAGSESREIATTLLDLARAQATAGHYDLAAGPAAEAVEIWRVLDGDEARGLPGAVRELAEIRGQQARHAEAESLAQEALQLCRERFGDRHAETARAYGVLMEVIYRAGDVSRAEAPARRSLELTRELYGPGSLPASGAENNLGAVLWASGRYDEAEEPYRKALTIRRRRLEPGHPLIAESLNNLGNLHMNLARYERAETLLREALEINRAALGATHPNTVASLANLANVLSARGDYDSAERLYREAWSVNRESLGENHPRVTIVMHNLADLLALRGRLGEARGLFERTETLRLQTGGDDVGLAETQLGLARTLHQMGQLTASEAKYGECLGRFRQALGASDWRTANARVHYAELLADLGRLEEAETVAGEARMVYLSALPADHWRHAVADSIAADIQARRGQVASALPVLRDAWERLRLSKGDSAGQTRQAQERLSRWAQSAAP